MVTRWRFFITLSLLNLVVVTTVVMWSLWLPTVGWPGLDTDSATRGSIWSLCLPKQSWQRNSEFYKTWEEAASDQTYHPFQSRVRIVLWSDALWWRTGVAAKDRNRTWYKLCPRRPDCEFTREHMWVSYTEAVVFHLPTLPANYTPDMMPSKRKVRQKWVLFSMESPVVTRSKNMTSYAGVFNWTMTYRGDSDVLTSYGSRSLLYNSLPALPSSPGKPPHNFAREKDRLAVWFVSNCYAHLTRHHYAKELRKHMRIDVFGRCGKPVCTEDKRYRSTCFKKTVKRYKFYLSFESYKCKEYITEKFWRNALENEVVPVVLGAPKADYVRIAPPNSFIHANDFKSPKDLATYLKRLARNDKEYNKYFRWRSMQFRKNVTLDRGRWCNLCDKLLQTCPQERKVYTDMYRWWKGKEEEEYCERTLLPEDIPKPHYDLSIHFS
ncbi:FUT5 [Branchiostoma lanceolatum]|uniref:Fucosyltransferase n=1 Tax=Branchiostoma lanceolatum TaxID=7740 RepID=A0A8J9ZPE8_BRALA|nr:FUT5 [Branchiostoma lanceolatum]